MCVPSWSVRMWKSMYGIITPVVRRASGRRWSHIEMLGSTCTLLTRFLREKGIPLRCEEASLLGLGIYGDTGAFTYVSTTPEDFDAASWLLGQGMDLALIAGLVRHDLTKEQLKTLNDLLESAELHDLGGVPLALACARMDHYMSDFAALAPRFMDMQPCRVFSPWARMEDMVQVCGPKSGRKVLMWERCARSSGAADLGTRLRFSAG